MRWGSKRRGLCLEKLVAEFHSVNLFEQTNFLQTLKKTFCNAPILFFLCTSCHAFKQTDQKKVLYNEFIIVPPLFFFFFRNASSQIYKMKKVTVHGIQVNLLLPLRVPRFSGGGGVDFEGHEFAQNHFSNTF